MKWLLPILGVILLKPCPLHARPPDTLRLQKSPQTPASPVMKVVLVHGIFENGNHFRALRRRLEKQNIQCHTATLKPCDARGGIEPLAHQLQQQIHAAFGPEEAVSIVSFSMGGIVSRYYLQKLGGAKRCEKLITISSPHHGTLTAFFYPSKGAKQMRPQSQLLQDLQHTESTLGSMPIISYHTPPWTSSFCLPAAPYGHGLKTSVAQSRFTR